jgi:hypothetical protein
VKFVLLLSAKSITEKTRFYEKPEKKGHPLFFMVKTVVTGVRLAKLQNQEFSLDTLFPQKNRYLVVSSYSGSDQHFCFPP